MKIQLTFDDKGLSVWPADTKLRCESQATGPGNREWYDEDCRVRGTNGANDYETLVRILGMEENGVRTPVRVVLEIADTKEFEYAEGAE